MTDKRICEKDLFLPALYVIYMYGSANTSEIKSKLIETFRPTGEDAEILSGRNDTKFSQIARNLLGSHSTTNGIDICTVKRANGKFELNDEGRKKVEDNMDYLSCLFSNAFEYEEVRSFATKISQVQGKKHKLLIYSEDELVSEGKTVDKKTTVRARSEKLRNAAIQHYSVNGRINCSVCGFDFSQAYGEHGNGYIQIHHEKPIYQYSDDGVTEYVKEAVLHTKPVCANCHCMLHRNKKHILTVDELKTIIEQTSLT